MRPGCRVSRSSGPETETAAMILPEGERTGAETDATPASRSPTDWAQPRRRIAERAVAEYAAFCSPRCIRSGSSQASSTWAAEPARIVSWDPTGMVSRRPGRALGGRDADAVLALAPPQLGRLAGDVAQPGQDRAGGGEQPVLAGGRAQLGEPGAEDEAALHVAGDEPVVLEGHREPVGRGPGQPGGGAPARPAWPVRTRGPRARGRLCRERRLR